LGRCSLARCRVLNRLKVPPNQRLVRQSFATAVATSSSSDFPKKARVVIVGGGIIGNSVAYHLVRHKGFEDVVLLERHQMTAGTTWHAAGLISTFGSTSETSTEMRMYTKELYKNLEEETGQSTGFSPCGFIGHSSALCGFFAPLWLMFSFLLSFLCIESKQSWHRMRIAWRSFGE